MDNCWHCKKVQPGIYISPLHCVQCGNPFRKGTLEERVEVSQLSPNELRDQGDGDDGETEEEGMEENELVGGEGIEENEVTQAQAEVNNNNAVDLTYFEVFPGDLADGADVRCSICLTEYWHQDPDGPRNKPVKITCGHVFHENCIFGALVRTSKRCPICRQLYTATGAVTSIL